MERHLNLWKCRRTILEMLHDRGYTIPDEDLKMSYDEFSELFPNVHLVKRPLEQIHTAPGKILFLHFLEESKLTPKNMRPIIELAKQRQATNLIFVVQETVSAQVLEVLKNEAGIDCEVFKEENVIFNVTHHELVPKHRIMSVNEKNMFLSRKKLAENTLPMISVDDPVAKYYGAKKGNLFEITRKSEDGGSYFYYRITK